MSTVRILFALSMCLSMDAIAQAPAVAAAPAEVDVAESATADRRFRDTSGYRFPALSRTVRDLQNLAYAIQLRDYCSDARVPDAFVKAQLARFSAITGRAESCRSLLDY